MRLKLLAIVVLLVVAGGAIFVSVGGLTPSAASDTTDLDAQIADATRASKSAEIQFLQAKTDRADATTTATERQTQTALYNAETALAHARSDLANLQAL